MYCLVVYRAAQNETVQKTLVADDNKTRPKARLSWYHPDDTVRTLVAHHSSEPAVPYKLRVCCMS